MGFATLTKYLPVFLTSSGGHEPGTADLPGIPRGAHRLLRALLTEPDRRPVLQVDPVRLVVPDEVERAVVVDVAVLEDLDERRAAMRRGGAQHLRQVLPVGVDRARYEGRFGANGQT